MSEFISGKEALIALANDRDVEYLDENLNKWVCMDMAHHFKRKFRLKPRTITITINGIEVPAPDQIEADPSLYGGWAINIGSEYYMYKNKSDYNIVVAALRSVFGKK